MGAGSERADACQWALTERLGSRFESQAAYLSDCSVEFPLRPSARAAPPLGPSLFQARLRARGNGGGRLVSMGIDRKVSSRGGDALQVGDLCLMEDGSERSDSLVSDAIE